MKNKILVTVIVPSLMKSYDVYIPTNERISKIIKMLTKAMQDFSDNTFDILGNHLIIDVESGIVYDSHIIIRDTSLKMCSKILFI